MRPPADTVAPTPLGRLVCVLLGVVFAASGCVDNNPPERVPTEGDALAMLRLMNDSERLIELLDKDPTFTRESVDTPLTTDERNRTIGAFATFVDHDLAFMSFRDLFLDAWRVPKDENVKLYLLALGTGAHAAQLRTRLKLISLIGNNDAIKAALNEGSPQHGIAKGHVDRMMIESSRPDTFIRLEIALEALQRRKGSLTAKAYTGKEMNKIWQAHKKKKHLERKGEQVPDKLSEALKSVALESVMAAIVPRTVEYSKKVGQVYKRVSGKLLNQTVGNMINNEVQGVIAPITKEIALWLGDTRLRGSGKHLVSEADLDAILPKLQAGDVIVERRNWYLSNLGLPGFWPHAALYLGTPAELAAHFDADPDVTKRFGGTFTAYLQKTFPDAWKAYGGDDGDGPMRIIEAVGEGVIFTSLYHSCLADYVAFMRPKKMSKLERAVAIAQSFSHWGKAYDFDFDFQTITTLVCSELVYTSFNLPTKEGSGLKLDPLPEVMGRFTLPPNDIVMRFDQEYGTPEQQLDFVVFLDGNEETQSSVQADVETFRASWQRAKWDLSQE